MTMAAAIESQTADKPALSSTGRIAKVDFLDDLSRAETTWRSLESPKHFATPFQRFDFLYPWHRQIGIREGLRPLIAVARDREGKPLLLLPLALAPRCGIRIANFMGGKHATFNMALWDRDFALEVNRADLETLISAIRERSEADVLALYQQPLRWRDRPNPMALLAHQASVNDCPVMNLLPDATTRLGPSLHRRLKGKERKLKKLPGYRYYVATDDADIARLLDAFFLIKPQRMAEQKLPNVFAESGVQDFIRDTCMKRLTGDGHAIQMHALECDDEVIAIFAGVADGDRFSMMFNTYTVSANSRHSPGLILISYIVDYYAERGYRALDLGVGSDDYKKFFCKNDESIFDCFVPLSPRGTIAASVMAGINRAKHLIKHSPVLLQSAQRLQRVMR
jgi:CelD/BcsL family acetyltransferase involved in cellulose biosynthesis